MKNSRNWKREFKFSLSKQLHYLKKVVFPFLPLLIFIPLIAGNFVFYYLYLFLGISIHWIEVFFRFNIILLLFSYLWYLVETTPYLQRIFLYRKIILNNRGLKIGPYFFNWEEISGIDFLPANQRKILKNHPEDMIIINLISGRRIIVDSSITDFEEFVKLLNQHIYNHKIDCYA